MALTVNPHAGPSAPDTFHEEALYAFRFDLNCDSHEDVTFKVQFGASAQVDGNEHQHVQAFDVRRAIGGVARKGAEGELIISGHTGQVVKTDGDYRAYAGLAPDLFAGDAVALNVFRKALWKEKRFEPQAFQSRQNFFAKANVTAIVIEIPSPLIGGAAVTNVDAEIFSSRRGIEMM
jgi:hypothetical protein